MISQTLDSQSISKIIESLQEAQQMLSVIRESNNLLENTILTSSSENSMDDKEFTTMNFVDDVSFQSSQEDTNENIFSPPQPEDSIATTETDKNLVDTSNATKKVAVKKWRLSPKKWRRMSRNRRLRSILLCWLHCRWLYSYAGL